MKKYIIYLLLCYAGILQAQPVCYDYDASGNRIARFDCTPQVSCNCPTTTRFYIGEDGEETLLTTTSMYQSNVGSLSGGCITVAGRLKINASYGFYGVTMMMQPGAEIIIEDPSLTLSFYGSTLKTCDKMWRGIVVGESCKINVVGASSIQDAMNAVKLRNSSQGTIENSTFDNNYNGIVVEGNGSASVAVSNIIIRGNTFDCSTFLKQDWNGNQPATYSRVGVEGINAAFVIGESGGARNYFKNQLSGILLTNCITDMFDFTISNGKGFSLNIDPYLDIQNAEQLGVGAWNSKTSIYNGSISQVNRGIYAKSTLGFTLGNSEIRSELGGVLITEQNPGSGILIHGNKNNNKEISGKLTGIRLMKINGNFVQITGNDIYVNNKYSPFLQTQGYALELSNFTANAANFKEISNNTITHHSDYHGISILNNNKYVIHNNTIQTTANGIKNLSGYGIYLSNASNNRAINNIMGLLNTSDLMPTNYESYCIYGSGSSNNRYCCNTTYNTKKGFYFLSTNSNTVLRTNKIYNHSELGLHLSSGAVISPQIDQWNEWLGTYSTSAKAAKNDNTTGLADSKFDVSKPFGTNWLPAAAVIDPQAGWFSSTSTLGTAKACETTGACSTNYSDGNSSSFSTEGAGGTALAYITGQYANSQFGEYTTWSGKRWVLREIQSNPSWLDNTTINTFKLNNQNSNLSKLNLIEDKIAAFYTPTAVQKSTMEEIYATFETNSSRLQEISQLLSQHPSEEDSINLMNERGGLLQSQADMMTRLGEIQRIIQLGTSPLIAEARVINSSIVPQNEFERNEKTINEIYLTTIANDITMDEAQQATVREIASLCPMIGGTAVYKARHLYGYFAVPSFDDTKICFTAQIGGGEVGDEGGKIIKSPNPQANVLIYPNPAQDEVTILVNQNEPVTVNIIDITGKVVMQQNFSATIQLSTVNIPNGSYFCEIWKGKERLSVQQLSVIH